MESLVGQLASADSPTASDRAAEAAPYDEPEGGYDSCGGGTAADYIEHGSVERGDVAADEHVEASGIGGRAHAHAARSALGAAPSMSGGRTPESHCAIA